MILLRLKTMYAWIRQTLKYSTQDVSVKQKPNNVFLHCAATPDTDKGDPDFDKFGAEDIRRWHVEERNFSDIGYHYVIRRTGVIQKGRPDTTPGAHAKSFNQDSLGVCLIGTKNFTDKQIEALISLYHSIADQWGIEFDKWYCHHEVNDSKVCPNIPANVLRALLKQSH